MRTRDRTRATRLLAVAAMVALAASWARADGGTVDASQAQPATSRWARHADLSVRLGPVREDGSQRTSLWPAPLGSPAFAIDPSRRQQLGIDLALHPSDGLADLRRGSLLKIELNATTQLSLRPRGGRLGLRLSTRF